MGRRGRLHNAKLTYFFTGVAADAAGAAMLELPVFFTAGFTACFLVCFTFVVAAGAPLPLAGGVAGVCAANVKGRVAKARAMVIKVVFIFVSPLRALD